MRSTAQEAKSISRGASSEAPYPPRTCVAVSPYRASKENILQRSHIRLVCHPKSLCYGFTDIQAVWQPSTSHHSQIWLQFWPIYANNAASWKNSAFNNHVQITVIRICSSHVDLRPVWQNNCIAGNALRGLFITSNLKIYLEALSGLLNG